MIFVIRASDLINKWHQYAFTVIIEIQPLNTGDNSLNVRQEYNINIGKISLTKRNITK